MELKWIILTVWVAIIAAVVVGAVLLFIKARRIFVEIKAYAAGREWTFTRDDPGGIVDRFEERPFGRGRNRRVRNVIQGDHEGRPAVWFHYGYTTGARGDSDRKGWTVAALDLGVTMPDLSVAPAGRLSRLINNLTKTDIEVGDEAFDHAFTVKSSAPDLARDVLHPDMTRMLLERPELAWQLDGSSILVTQLGTHGVEDLDEQLATMDAIVRRIPTTCGTASGALRRV